MSYYNGNSAGGGGGGMMVRPPPPPPSQPQVEVMDLTAESRAQQAEHRLVLDELEITKIANSLSNVPTLPHDVRQALRQLGHPVRLFGENLADVRQRLRRALAEQEFRKQQQTAGGTDGVGAVGSHAEHDDDEEQVTKYTRASAELIEARQAIAKFSLERAKERLENERHRRSLAVKARKRKRKKSGHSQSQQQEENMEDEDEERGDDADMEEGDEVDDLERLDISCRKTFQFIRKLALDGSQYADRRALSSICCGTLPNHSADDNNDDKLLRFCVTAGWTASVQMWQIPTLVTLGETTLCHQDRIMGMDLLQRTCPANDEENVLLATASIDRTAKLWKIQAQQSVEPEAMEVENETDEDQAKKSKSGQELTMTEVAHLEGHQGRLCRTKFHPLERHVGTTSFDHTWRFWDIETGQNLLLQDGHAAPVFGLAFHDDGGLCATTDFASIIQLWDLRTGKSIHHFAGGHAKRILTTDFSPNGFHLATAGDDGVIRIWDLRRRKGAASIPAHSNLISQVKFHRGSQVPYTNSSENNNKNNRKSRYDYGECLVSSSFDGTVKLWSARDWKPLSTLRGHPGQVSGVDFVDQRSPRKQNDNAVHPSSSCSGLVTCGFDKTLKYWS